MTVDTTVVWDEDYWLATDEDSGQYGVGDTPEAAIVALREANQRHAAWLLDQAATDEPSGLEMSPGDYAL